MAVHDCVLSVNCQKMDERKTLLSICAIIQNEVPLEQEVGEIEEDDVTHQ